MGENIVENWLKSLGLAKYAQAFVDNGYDDLEICKQVGNPDLDAIGVESADDRAKLLDAVKTLNEKGGTAVYLTLEDESNKQSVAAAKDQSVGHGGHVPVRPTLDNLLADVPPPSPSPAPGVLRSEINGMSSTLITYPKLQLTVVLRDKLIDDRIDLASPPYTVLNFSPCWSSLTALALKYAEELQTHFEDVLDRLEDLRWWRITEDTASIYSPPSMTSSTLEDPYYPSSLYNTSPRDGPPPIPSVPPPDGSHLDGYGMADMSGQMLSVQTRYIEQPSHANYVALETGMCCVFPKKVIKGEGEQASEKKKTSTLGRLFRNMGFRRSRKHSYKKHQGDLLAHEITMGDNDRIALMQMVKEGKISTETALQVVKRFEEERRRDQEYIQEATKEKERKGNKSKKSSSMKPTKSPSMSQPDDSPCDVCDCFLRNNYPLSPGSHQWRGFHDDYCRHRRVHSVSHIAYPQDPLRSPNTARAMSCSPMRSHSNHGSAVNSPVGHITVKQGTNIYTPVIPHELKMYSGSRGLYAIHGIDILRDRLNVIKTNACVHKTQSKASLISSESDHSMECASHMAGQMEPAVDETYFCSNHSTISMGSDTMPGSNGRRKCGSAMDKLRSHKWQRTGSLSQGEDGMSTDNDDQDDPDRHLLGGGTSSSHVMEKFRGVRNEMKKRILHTRDMIGDGKSHHLCSAYQTPATNQSLSSNDSCSSGHGSQSSQSIEASRQQAWNDFESQGQGQVIGHARVHSDYTPPPEEKEFLQLRRGEKVQILETSSSGIWRGRIDNRVGLFHFNFVDMVMETTPLSVRKEKSRRRMNRRSKPRSVEELLQKISLEHLTPVFINNGYDNLEIFAEIDHEDLNALNILDSESRTKLITAAELLADIDVTEPPPQEPIRNQRSASATPTSQQYAVPWTSFFPSKPMTGSRDSGCYDSNECMNRDHDPYACGNRARGVNLDNKENQRPHSTKKNMRGVVPVPVLESTICDRSVNDAHVQKEHQNDKKEAANGRTGDGEKIYSEEDQEVCHITGYHGSGSERSSPRSQTQSVSLVNGQDRPGSSAQPRNLALNIPILGPDWKIYCDTSSQTSPKYGSLSDSYHRSLEGELNSVTTSMSASVHGDFFGQGQSSTLKKKTKPYARKIAPIVAMKDAQVQVMCPLGLQSQMSPSTVSATGFSELTEAAMTQSVVSQSSASSSGQKSDKGYQDVSVPALPETSSSSPARLSSLSQSSQNSRDGDSGSDASTVKSDKVDSDVYLSGCQSPESLYGPIHKGFKSIRRSVIPKVTSKLATENIDLAKEPYSNAAGEYGIPPLLVQRYAEELKHDLFKTAVILDQVRIHKLTTVGRPVVPADQLTEQSLATSELKIATITEFFISIGLPMYSESFYAKGYTSVEGLANLSIKELQSISKADRKHLKRIIHALEWVQCRLASPSRKQKVSPVKDKV